MDNLIDGLLLHNQALLIVHPMRNKRILTLAWLLFSQNSLSMAAEPIHSILFGSCIRESYPAPVLLQMVKEEADIVLFLGDNIYGDTEEMSVLRNKYALLAKQPGFAELRNESICLAVWDDHDYGANDAGTEYPFKRDSQTEFLDFWGIPTDSPRRDRKGTYHSEIIGPPGQRVQFLLLDTRYFRSPLMRGPQRRVGGPYIPDTSPSNTMLGKKQWEWLEGELRKPAEFRIIASSIQCVASAAGQETWSNFPLERSRLFQLIRKTEANGVIILSGDRHWSEISMTNEGELPYPLYDITSSSLNQIHKRGTPTENKFRISESTYHLQNYGRVEFDWGQPIPKCNIEIRDSFGVSRMHLSIPLDEISIPKSM